MGALLRPRAPSALMAAAALALGFVAPLEGCAALLDTTGFMDAAVTVDGSGVGDAAPKDGAGITDATDGAPSGCRAGPGPAPVRVTAAGKAFCVGATEVTNADYARFLEAMAAGGSPPEAPAACAFNASFTPSAGWPAAAGREDHPVVYVDWCDARAYCAWAQKRLCGRIGGGVVGSSEGANPTASEWFAACSAGGARRFPYGDGYEPTRCQSPEAITRGTVAVGSLATCVGGVTGLFDMSGNVLEWEDGCDEDTGADDLCPVRGGSFRRRALVDLGGASQACDAPLTLARSAVADDVGFRCCSP